jgi:mannosyltransferase OCH1-like enzyme
MPPSSSSSSASLMAATTAIPHRVASTVKNGSQVPEQFRAWPALHPDWPIAMFNDSSMAAWLQQRLTVQGDGRRGRAKLPALELYENMPKVILQSDMFRYLWMYLEGGLYVDNLFRLLLFSYLSTPPPLNLSSCPEAFPSSFFFFLM